MKPNEEEIQEASNGIEVFLRVRPSQNPSGYFHQDDIDETQFIVQLPKKQQSQAEEIENSKYNDTIVNNTRTTYGFKFNGILDEKSTQESVFKSIGSPAVRNVLDGFNSTVFAYGQTGSGKTFTITGGPERYADRGIIPRAISMLFNGLQNKKNSSYSCYVSYFELYNDNGYDLLAGANVADEMGNGNRNSRNNSIGGGSSLNELPKVTMMEDEDGNYHFRNLSVNQVSNEEEALNLLFIGDTNRAIGETQMNQSSSRSHCIFTIMVEMRNIGSDTVVRSKLNLVDLAGSERVHKTNSSGQTLKEAQYINSSLFFLEMVIVALHERTKKGRENTHVPYRNSMMTSVLRDSLGGNCKTIMVATISPEANQTDESISTCHFAQRVALVKNNAYINEELEPELVIKRLKGEMKRLREEVNFLKGENDKEEELSNEDHQELEKIIRDYLLSQEEKELNIGTLTLTKIKASYYHFKRIFDETDEIRSRNAVISTDDVNPLQNETVQNLTKIIRQREDEIKILVEMVKKGNKPPTGSIAHSEGTNDDTILDAREDKDIVEFQDISSKSKGQTKKEATICGVTYCRDRNIISDPTLAFAWFRKRYPGEKNINENKVILQTRFIEAKNIGEIVKRARETIQHYKCIIEKDRRDIAIKSVARGDKDEEIQNQVEVKSRQVIEENKKAYEQGFQRLRDLKCEIEHVKCLVEKGRVALQKDFDIWYDQMYSINTMSNTSADAETNYVVIEEGAKNVLATYISTVQKDTQNSQHTTQNNLSKNDHEACTSKEAFKLPPGARLTGNKETDDDIIAFYKAKEALCARRKVRTSMQNI